VKLPSYDDKLKTCKEEDDVPDLGALHLKAVTPAEIRAFSAQKIKELEIRLSLRNKECADLREEIDAWKRLAKSDLPCQP
jgi:hypothetical protein